MNAAIAITAYTKIQKETLSQEENGYNLVGAALRKLETNLKILVSSEVAASRSKAFEGILTAIYFLQKSLDLVQGGELAKNLFRLYEFCRLKVLEKGMTKSRGDDEIKSCHGFILDILKSWDSVKIT
jgi:flagellar protein FliS